MSVSIKFADGGFGNGWIVDGLPVYLYDAEDMLVAMDYTIWDWGSDTGTVTLWYAVPGPQTLKVSFQMIGLMPGTNYATVDKIHHKELRYRKGEVVTQVCNGEGGDYRYGFNGQEKLNELRGIGNTIDLGARHLDTRLGRTLTPDPAAREYPSISPYAFVMNNPTNAIDPDGKRVYFVAGAGNDPKDQGWNYVNRFAELWTKAGLEGFTRVNASHGKVGDMVFVDKYRNGNNSLIRVQNDKMLQRAVQGIVDDIAKRPLKEGEQLNMAGYSYGAVLQEYATIELIKKGHKVDNLILIASFTSDDSPLMKTLQAYQKEGKIGNIIRHDIPGDKLSNPEGALDYLQGIWQGGVQGDDAAHFDLARPGEEVDKKIEQLGQQLVEQGVR